MEKKIRTGVYGVALREGALLLTEIQTGPDAGRLHLPGGGIEFGEGFETALRREVLEEIAMTFSTMEPMGSYSATVNYQEIDPSCFMHMHFICLVYRLYGLEPIPESSIEGPWGWYPLERVEERKLSPIATQVVAELKLAKQKTVHHKLIRDKIPHLLAEEAVTCVTRVMERAEYRDRLDDKLQEELLELLSAKSDEERLEEAGDLLEVMDAYLSERNLSLASAMQAKRAKAKKRGGFAARLFLEATRAL